MSQFKENNRMKNFAWISVIALIISSSLFSVTANAATSGSETVGFSIAGGDMGGGGGGSCLAVDYVLSTSLGDAVADPAAGDTWTSSDINITQTSGTSCPANTVLTAQSLEISASSFTNDLGIDLDSAPNIYCDGDYSSSTYSALGTSATCSSSTARVNVEVLVPNDAISGVLYQSTVTVTAVLS